MEIENEAFFDAGIKIRRKPLLFEVVADTIAGLRVAARHRHQQQSDARDQRNGSKGRTQNGCKVNVKHLVRSVIEEKFSAFCENDGILSSFSGFGRLDERNFLWSNNPVEILRVNDDGNIARAGIKGQFFVTGKQRGVCDAE